MASLVSQADRAVVTGNLKHARALLSEAADANASDPGLLLKLAAILRASGQPQLALASVHRALALEPRDFTALLMRASLLERLDNPEAPEAWAHAMAQQPLGGLPPGLEPVVAQGKQRIAAWREARNQRLGDAMSAVREAADPELRGRFERFRTNVLRRTRTFHSNPTQYNYPGLAEREFHPRDLFPWLETLEQAAKPITSELRALLAAERAESVPYVRYADHLPLEQWSELNNNLDWTAIHLLENGQRVEANARLCPITLQLVANCDQPAIAGASPNAMFSILAPHTAIPAHVGVNNARLVCHLPLVVPEGCWFRVGAETRLWKPGEAFVFDDTIEHEALNPSDQVRIVLIFDVWHPGLSPLERQAVTALIEADAVGGVPL